MTVTSPPLKASQPLFFADSDEEDDIEIIEQVEDVEMDTLSDGRSASALPDDVEEDIEMSMPKAERSRASSMSSTHSVQTPRTSSPVTSDGAEPIFEPPAKKRRLSPDISDEEVPFDSAYLGSFIVPNAWSTVKGKGYVKVRGGKLYVLCI